MKPYITILVLLLFCACAHHPKPLLNAPYPGIVGQPRFTTDDNSTTERVTFTTRAPDPQIRLDFESYCRALRLARDSRASTTGIEWWTSPRESLGLLVSPQGRGAQTFAVTYFYDR